MKLSERSNEVVALDFDLACTARLKLYDDEREARMFELLSGGVLSQALTQGATKAAKKMKEGSF